MKQSLVIGASGLIGEHLMSALQISGENPIATFQGYPIPSAERLDIEQKMEVDALFERSKPGIVFLPAALTNVDYCERNPELSYRVNVLGVKNIVQACNKIGARLIYFSTDYIFDGMSGPYSEDAPANPLNVYGRQKLMAEHHIALTSINSLIIRTTVVYGWERQGKNFVHRLIKSLGEGIPIRAPIDQIGTPTYAPELAQSAVELSKTDLTGVVNVAGASYINRYEFAVEVAQVFGLPEKLIQPLATKDLNQPATRPLTAGLRTEKAMAVLQTVYSSSRDGLHLMAVQERSAPRINCYKY